MWILGLAGFLCLSQTAWAAPFPAKTDAVVQDQQGLLKQDEQKQFDEFVKQYPDDSYKVVVVESVQPEAQTADEYARKLYDNYNLPDNTLMIVLDASTLQLGVYPGQALQAKGVTMDLLHDKISFYYEPFRNQKQYLKGIESFITEVHAEEARLASGKGAADAGGSAAPAAQEKAAEDESFWSQIPWWLYVGLLAFLALIVVISYLYVRRRQMFGEVDDLEDWKDEVVEKIQLIEVEKPLRRATGRTEEHYSELANRKENMLRVRIPDVEMMILEAEEAVDRFRFEMARGLLAEGRDILVEIEKELAELKADSTKVVQAKKENKVVLPEIGKQVEQVERKLTNLRLEYGLSFHELKQKLDQVEHMRDQVKTALAAGDDVKAYELTLAAQQTLKELGGSLERIPALVTAVQKEMPHELKQLENDIASALGDGYDLSVSYLDAALLQARQILQAARNALEEGDLALIETHRRAFEVQIDSAYQNMEETVLSRQQVAASAGAIVDDAAPGASAPVPGDAAPASEEPAAEEAGAAESEVAERSGVVDASDDAPNESEPADADASRESTADAERMDPGLLHAGAAAIGAVASPYPGGGLAGESDAQSPDRSTGGDDLTTPVGASGTTEEERSLLWGHAETSRTDEPRTSASDPLPAGQVSPLAGPASGGEAEHPDSSEEVEYELVIPKPPALDGWSKQEAAPRELCIESEEDALDEMERISGALVRIRQKVKRSYLPGVPDELKVSFEQVVQSLGRVKFIMERHRYDLDEVAELLKEASELLTETEKLAESIISTCQLAEGAIQYTNRYRRQNRQVNELLGRAEQAFRQLRFSEALQLAEEARLIVEGDEREPLSGSRWMLRRKKKGVGS